MVRQIERGDEPPPWSLLPRFTSDGGTMQHVSSDVLQEYFQQGESQEEASARRGSASRRGDAGDGGASEASQTPLPFTSEDSADVTASPQASFFVKAARHTRFSRPEVSRRRSGGAPEPDFSSPPPPFAVAPQVGSTARPRTLRSPSWSPASEKVPSQFVGGRAEADADIVVTPDVGELTPTQSPTQELTRLSPDWTSRLEAKSSPFLAKSTDSTPSATPLSADSSPSISTESRSSDRSDASSFAHMLRNNRADHRLFHRKYKPLAHRHKKTAPVKRPASVRSASFYKPKVVEDSALPTQPAPQLEAVTLPAKAPATSLSTQSSRTILRKDRSSQSHSQSQSGSSRDLSLSPPSTENKHRRARSPPSHIHIPSSARHARFETQSAPQTLVGDLPSHEHHVRSPGPLASPRLVTNKRSRRPTPPNLDPQTPFDRFPGHGEHYFRMFGPDTIYEKAPLEIESFDKSQKAEAETSPRNEQHSPPAQTVAMGTGSHGKRHALRNSVWHMFHIGSRIDNVEETTNDILEPQLHVHSPLSSRNVTPLATKSSHRSIGTPEFFTSYFPTLRRHQNKSSENSKEGQAFGLATNWEDVVSESQPSVQVKPESAPMSPLSMPAIRPKPKRTDTRMDISQAAKQAKPETIDPSTSSGAAMSLPSKYKSATGEENSKTALTGPGAPSFLPSEMKRVNTPPVEHAGPSTSKPAGFKGFFFDMRSMPADQSSLESESPVPSKLHRRKPVIPKTSLQSLLPKLSLPKLNSKRSRVSKGLQTPDDPLAVTDFQQTPFSQRYGDTRRTKMSRMRTYLDEALKESEDDDGTALLIFDVPEHLPNSPLCPLSPKHPSGGKAICPVHRRRKTILATSPGGSLAHKLEKPSPKITFEGNYFADGRSKPDVEDRRRWSREPSP